MIIVERSGPSTGGPPVPAAAAPAARRAATSMPRTRRCALACNGELLCRDDGVVERYAARVGAGRELAGGRVPGEGPDVPDRAGDDVAGVGGEHAPLGVEDLDLGNRGGAV